MDERQVTHSKYPSSGRAHYARECSEPALHLCLVNQMDNHFSLRHTSMPLVISCHHGAGCSARAGPSVSSCSGNPPKENKNLNFRAERTHREAGGGATARRVALFPSRRIL